MKLIEALAITYAAVGQEMNDAALEIIARDLSEYPLGDVLDALSRCRRELRRIALVDILDRIPNGHPGPEEAWAQIASALNDESASIVWTSPMRLAFGVARHLADNAVAARMAFKEVYQQHVASARALAEPPDWEVSLGHDPAQRSEAIQRGLAEGKLTQTYVQSLLPHVAPQLSRNTSGFRQIASFAPKLDTPKPESV